MWHRTLPGKISESAPVNIASNLKGDWRNPSKVGKSILKGTAGDSMLTTIFWSMGRVE